MKKALKIILIVIASFVLLIVGVAIIAVVITGKAADATEYSLGKDSVKSIKAVVEKRQVTSTKIESKNGIETKTIEYKSTTVRDDLIKYSEYLKDKEGFYFTKDANFNESPGTTELSKESVDSGKIITIQIDYTDNGYTIIFKKYTGTLNVY